MLLTDLVAPNAIIPALRVNSKKQLLHELAAKAAELSGQSERAILEVLQQREKLGSTGVGNGIAIPHGKLPKINKLFGLFGRLERADGNRKRFCHASSSLMTSPPVWLSCLKRPSCRYVILLSFNPSRCSNVACWS